jgi:hypothetical protein
MKRAKARRKPRVPKSAVWSAHESGLELVPKRPRKGKLASAHDYAKVDFKPWRKSKTLLPTDNTMNQACISARLAYATMCKSKTDLIDIHGKLDHKVTDELMASFVDTAEHLKAIARMLEMAYARVLIAGSAREVAGLPFKHSDQKPKAA